VTRQSLVEQDFSGMTLEEALAKYLDCPSAGLRSPQTAGAARHEHRKKDS
jgi:hypothetical protein